MITLREIAERLNGELLGDGNTVVSGMAGIKEAGKGEITFLSHPRLGKLIKDCKASAVILGKDVDPAEIKDKNAIIVENPALAHAVVAGFFLKTKKREKGTSSLAFVAPSARVAKSASVAPWVFVGEGAVIEKGAVLYPYVYIGDGVTVGENTILYPHVIVYDRVKIGKNVIIHGGAVLGSDGFGYVWDGTRHVKIPQLGIVEIEDNVEIGANVTVDRASLGKTVIRSGTKIDNLVQIGHNVSLGENSIIVSQVGIAGSASIGRNVVLAGQVGVRDHVTVGNNVKAGGQTGITSDVADNAVIMGTPHMPFREWAKLQAYLKAVPKLFSRVKRIEEKLLVENGDD
jgi:UDP-3-O-[3-hydroxymyristoyl] glucosamine N-acyltransferase